MDHRKIGQDVDPPGGRTCMRWEASLARVSPGVDPHTAVDENGARVHGGCPAVVASALS